MEEERLQKYIARCGVTSRRKAEELITNGSVKVNGTVITELGTKIDPDNDVVTVDNKKISESGSFTYIKLYKPEGYVTTVKDQFGRKTVIDLIQIKDRIYPIGRLDYNTSGLLLLTNDGDLANKLMHPKYHMYKTYVAEVDGHISDETITMLKNGVKIEDYKTAPARVKLIKHSGSTSTVQVSIYEGKNRQVRHMTAAVGFPTLRLIRVAIGALGLGNLAPGKWEELNLPRTQFLKG